MGEWICGILGRENQSRVGVARLAGLKAAADAASERLALLNQGSTSQKALDDFNKGERAREVALCWPQLPQQLLVGSHHQQGR